MKIKRQSPQRLSRVSGFKSSNLSVLAGQSSLGGAYFATPAFANTISSLPFSRLICAKRRSRSPRFETSPWTAVTSCPISFTAAANSEFRRPVPIGPLIPYHRPPPLEEGARFWNPDRERLRVPLHSHMAPEGLTSCHK